MPRSALSTGRDLANLTLHFDIMSKKPATANITSMLQEKRIFKPAKEFAAKAHIGSMAQYKKLWNESVKSPEKFWGRMAKQELVWFKPFKKVLQWKEPFAKWFIGGQTNVSHNCLDRWLDTAQIGRAHV